MSQFFLIILIVERIPVLLYISIIKVVYQRQTFVHCRERLQDMVVDLAVKLESLETGTPKVSSTHSDIENLQSRAIEWWFTWTISSQMSSFMAMISLVRLPYSRIGHIGIIILVGWNVILNAE